MQSKDIPTMKCDFRGLWCGNVTVVSILLDNWKSKGIPNQVEGECPTYLLAFMMMQRAKFVLTSPQAAEADDLQDQYGPNS